MKITREDALDYHRGGRPGKLQVVPTKPALTQRDLSLAYTPGVAEAVLEVARDPEASYDLTTRGNLVAVVTNGSAILGLGDRGPLAAKPVMEGKALLFKRFADIDVFDLELDARTPEEIVAAVRAIAPTFGGINLEDIRAPECFAVEEQLRAALDVPVFHDDQHGTAIVSGAALLNALDLVGKRIDDVQVVINGAGAAGIASAHFYLQLGVRPDHLTLVDSHGVVFAGRTQGMNPYKARFARPTSARTLADALRGADVLLGVSVADCVTPEMLLGMAERPVLLLLANPDPEIRYELARATRPDAIVATGRSDYPNQVNNVLGFPFIFRGALDARARAINEPMKLAAARALAALAREDVPDTVLRAYGLDALAFGPDYLIPKPLDPRVLYRVAPAVAEAAIASGVARRALDPDAYRDRLMARQEGGWRLLHSVVAKARRQPGRVVFAEGEEPTILRAAVRLADEGIGRPVLLGRPSVVQAKAADLGLRLAAEVIDPARSPRLEAYAQHLYRKRQRKGVTLPLARQLAAQPNYFAVLMVELGDADASLSGLTHDYPWAIRPALQVVGTRPGVSRAAGLYLLVLDDRVYFLGDATVNIEPSAHDLAEIAILAGDFARQLDVEPRIALLSFSNFGSTRHPLSEKVRQAVEIVRACRPDLVVDGEMQADTAVVPAIVEERYPFSRVKDANVLIFPDLEAANTAYKLLQRLAGARTIGPILLGAARPVHVLQTGDAVEDVVHIAAMAVVDAQQRAARPAAEAPTPAPAPSGPQLPAD